MAKEYKVPFPVETIQVVLLDMQVGHNGLG